MIAEPSMRPGSPEEEAASWHERLTGTTCADTRSAFESWRDAHPANAEAFERVDAAHARVKRLGDAPEILALRQETLTRLVMPEPRGRLQMAVAASLLAVVIAPLSILAWGGLDFPSAISTFASAEVEESLHHTGAGERLTVSLTDGSTAILNTHSKLRVAFSGRERRLVVESGQIFFAVAKDRVRPFVVLAGDRAVTAHGTAFDVRMKPDAVQVALLEGSVTVAARGAAAADPVRLKPNEVLTASGAAIMVRAADVERLTSWRDGFILFEDEPVSEAVAEINRYTARPIVLADEQVGQVRISGAFRVGESSAFLEAMEIGFNAQVVERSRDRVVLASGK